MTPWQPETANQPPPPPGGAPPPDSAAADRSRMVKVWDPLIRIGHWVLVAAFATAYLTEGEPLWLHSWAGYAIAVTVLIRVIWGFVGPESARFASFVRGPVAVARYLGGLASGTAPRHLGHSPAGGAMTVALLLSLAVTAGSGMALLAEEEGRGPLAPLIGQQATVSLPSPALIAPALADEWEERDDDDRYEAREPGADADAESRFEAVHEVAANLTLVLVALHLLGVLFVSWSHRENLARAMVTGRKPAGG